MKWISETALVFFSTIALLCGCTVNSKTCTTQTDGKETCTETSVDVSATSSTPGSDSGSLNNSTAPVALAGSDASYVEGTSITLDGSGSNDPDGFDLTYEWTQVSGPRVTFSNATIANPTVTFDPLIHDATFVLQLAVNDGVATSSDTVTISVLDDKEPGYFPRSCGFDMNRNGVFGEVADCHVCDGATTDPDGDSQPEDILYVDSVNGNDGTGDGSAAAPYKTIQFAVDQTDGPLVGQEDIICISGTFDETVNLNQTGKNVAAYQMDGFDYPHDPLMIVGWDKNNNGQYPPFDTADLAILNSNDTKGTAFNLNSATKAFNVEIAHITITNYTNGELFNLRDSANSGLFFHDIEIANVNDGVVDAGTIRIFPLSGDNFALHNVEALDVCCNVVDAQQDGIYIKNFHTRLLGNTTGNGFFSWGSNHISIFNSIFDGNPDNWIGGGPSSGNAGIDFHNGTSDSVARGNRVINFQIGLILAAWSSSATDADNNIFDGNHIEFNRPVGGMSLYGFIVGGGVTDTQVVADAGFMNNVFVASGAVSMLRCADFGIGSNVVTQPGTMTFVGNTCIGNGGNQGIFTSSTGTNKRDNFVILNNIIDGYAVGVETHHSPSSYLDNGNIFSNVTDYTWNNSTGLNFAAYKSNSGNALSVSVDNCVPTFVGAGDYHQTAGSCGIASGVDITGYTPVDFDGETRDALTPSSGAFEFK